MEARELLIWNQDNRILKSVKRKKNQFFKKVFYFFLFGFFFHFNFYKNSENIKEGLVMMTTKISPALKADKVKFEAKIYPCALMSGKVLSKSLFPYLQNWIQNHAPL